MVNKKYIVEKVSNNLGIHEDDISYIFDEIFKIIVESLVKKCVVKIQHFASFNFKEQNYGKRFLNGKITECKSKYRIVFKPSMEIRRSLYKE